MHVLLLNPPGSRTYIRDYYCSKVSKSNYVFEPIDLLMLSGILAEHHTVSVVDAIADRLDDVGFLKKFHALKPEVVIAVNGAVSLEEDLRTLSVLASAGSRIVVSGDAFLEKPETWLEKHPFIEAIVLDFTSDDILSYLEGRPDEAPSIVSRCSIGKDYVRPKGEKFSLPIPRHDLFNSQNYNLSLVRHKSFATVLTDYGCPFPCSFCVMPCLGYRYRPVENVIEELRYLKKLGVREIYFRDQTFGTIREKTSELCRLMIEERFGFGWVCACRVDLVNRELLTQMRAAGCHTIVFGVESGSETILNAYRKGYKKQQIQDAFKLSRELGIRTVATFMIGLPDDTWETAMETVNFLKLIQCDFASFNIAVPRAGTPLREDAIRLGLTTSDTVVMDQSGSAVVMPSKHLTKDEIMRLKTLALRSFYLRPSYLLRRLLSIRSWYELKEQIREGFHLLQDH